VAASSAVASSALRPTPPPLPSLSTALSASGPDPSAIDAEQRLDALCALFAVVAPVAARSADATLSLHTALLRVQQEQRTAKQHAAAIALESAKHILPRSSHDSITKLLPPAQRETHANTSVATMVSSRSSAKKSSKSTKPAKKKNRRSKQPGSDGDDDDDE
jgi:hypothetical protein